MAATTTKTRTARPKQPAPPTKIRILSGDLYWVSSQSHPGQGHHTSPNSCTCPAGKVGRLCRHVKLVRVYHAWRMEQLAAALRRHAAGTAELRPLSRHFE